MFAHVVTGGIGCVKCGASAYDCACVGCSLICENYFTCTNRAQPRCLCNLAEKEAPIPPHVSRQGFPRRRSDESASLPWPRGSGCRYKFFLPRFLFRAYRLFDFLSIFNRCHASFLLDSTFWHPLLQTQMPAYLYGEIVYLVMNFTAYSRGRTILLQNRCVL
jgi:hypothetical protein